MTVYKVFISHGWSDRWIAAQIERRIVADCGATTFIDVNDIDKGDDIEDRIFEEMGRCSELVVLLTPWSIGRSWVWVEIGAARQRGIRIVPVLYQLTLDAIERERGGSAFLRSKNVVDINDLDAYFIELKARAAGDGNG